MPSNTNTLLRFQRSALLALVSIRQRNLRGLRLIENLVLALLALSIDAAIFLDSLGNLLSSTADIAFIRIGGFEIRSLEVFCRVLFVAFLVCFVRFAVESDLLAAFVAVPEDEHEDWCVLLVECVLRVEGVTY